MSAPSPSPLIQSYGLVSLWDMMEFYAPKFMHVMTHVTRLHANLIFWQKQILESKQPYELQRSDDFVRDLKIVSDQLDEMGFTLAKNSAEKLARALKQPTVDTGDLFLALHELQVRVQESAEGQLFLFMKSADAKLYIPDAPPFGEAVNNAFPRAAYDILEAGKCVALDRPTAAVLHLMRALEHPLRAIAKAVDEPVRDNWNSILNDIENKVRGKDRSGNRTTYWDGRKADQAFFAEAATHFFHIKNAWRNYASHGVKDKYTPEEARNIYASIKAFFVHLSARLRDDDESETSS